MVDTAAMDSVEAAVVMVDMVEPAVAMADMAEALDHMVEVAADKICELNLLVVFNE